MLWFLKASVATMALLAGSSQSFADLVTLPLGLEAGSKYRLVFLTSKTNLQGGADVLSVANSIEQLASLDTTWTLLGSNEADARTRTSTDPTFDLGVPIYRLDSVLVAASYAELWSGLLRSPINVFENGERASGSFDVFTGSNQFGIGFAGQTIGSQSGQVRFGYSDASGFTWASAGSKDARRAGRFYAISGVLQTAIAVPEVSSLAMFGALAFLVVAARLRGSYLTRAARLSKQPFDSLDS